MPVTPKSRPRPSFSIMIVTTNDLPGYEITDVLSPVFGTSVRSRNVIGNALGGIRAIFGGSQEGYVNMLMQNRDEALMDLQNHALEIGADAVVGMRFDSGEFDAGQGQAMNEVTAYGTAVKVKPKSA